MGTVSSLSRWRSDRPRFRADVFLSPESLAGSDSVEGNCAGFEVHATMLDPAMPIAADRVASSQALVVEVDCSRSSAIERLRRLLAERPGMPILAAVRDPSLADVRTLMRFGIADVLPLPLRMAELEPALERIGLDLETRIGASGPKGRLVSAIKSRGGVGATAMLTQLGCILSEASRFRGGPTCLVDFDLQHGNAALYLGRLPELGLSDLVDARDRLDADLLKSVIARHPSGLSYISAPREIMPLDALRPDTVEPILTFVRSEFQTVLVDLPADWTDWGLAILAESEQILLVSELSVAGLHQARRQIDFLRDQDLAQVPISIVMNKVVKGLFKTVDYQDAARILGREVTFSIAEDAATFRSALDQGEPIMSINPRSRVAKDLGEIAATLQARTVAVK